MNDILVQRIKSKYTAATQCVMEGEPDAHNVWLKVGVQSFCVTPHAVEDLESAELCRKQLAQAIVGIICEHEGVPRDN